MRWALAAIGVLAGAAITYVGVFLIGYSGDTGTDADPYIEVRDTRIDADVVGVSGAIIGLTIMAVSLLALRPGRR